MGYWFEKLSSGDYNREDKPVAGMRMLLDDQVLRAVVESNPDATMREIAEDIVVYSATALRHGDAVTPHVGRMGR